jgi:glutamine synthetase
MAPEGNPAAQAPHPGPADDVLVDSFDQALLSRLVDGRRAAIEQYWSRVTPWEQERYFDEA